LLFIFSTNGQNSAAVGPGRSLISFIRSKDYLLPWEPIGHEGFKEDYYCCDVVHYFLFSLPLLVSLLNDRICCSFRLVLLVVWKHNLSDLFIGKELPDAVWTNDNVFIFDPKFVALHARFRADSHSVSYLITKRPTHSQAWNIVVLQPHSRRANRFVVIWWIEECLDASSLTFNSLPLLW